jgi:hypothetical protein
MQIFAIIFALKLFVKPISECICALRYVITKVKRYLMKLKKNTDCGAVCT